MRGPSDVYKCTNKSLPDYTHPGCTVVASRSRLGRAGMCHSCLEARELFASSLEARELLIMSAGIKDRGTIIGTIGRLCDRHFFNMSIHVYPSQHT